jgi:hypothetical protein
MTIACAYLVSEGVVFGADSTTTVAVPGPPGQGGVTQLLNHAQKLFSVGPMDEFHPSLSKAKMAVSTWGAGRVGQTSHRTLVSRLSDEVVKHPEWMVAEAANHLTHLVQGAASEAPGCPGILGYFLGGTDPTTHTPRCLELTFVDGTLAPNQPAPLVFGEARFRGMPDLFQRAFNGFDPDLPRHLLTSLTTMCQQQVPPVMLPPQFMALFVQAFNQSVQHIPHMGHQDVPIREAIDFCHMYLHLTIKGYKFRFGPPMCGGPIELGFITTDRPFRWARHKPFDSAIVEQDMGAA